jgi:uncharacterized protein YdhG (YjbR/CyaY superfamily)
MPTADVSSYLARQPPATRKVLNVVRATLKKALPDATESIGYGILCYRLDGRPVIYLGGWAAHFSLYPAGDVGEVLGPRITQYAASKGTLKFPLAQPPPLRLIQRIATLRAKEVRARSTRPRGAKGAVLTRRQRQP